MDRLPDIGVVVYKAVCFRGGLVLKMQGWAASGHSISATHATRTIDGAIGAPGMGTIACKCDARDVGGSDLSIVPTEPVFPPLLPTGLSTFQGVSVE